MPAKTHTMHGRDHCPGGADPIPCLPPEPGVDIADRILALGPDAFWKLDELGGDIAHDSSGNNNHLEAPGVYTPPTWGQPAGPPGDTTALWPDDTTRVSNPLDDFTDDFTAGVWVNVHTAGNAELVGQGAAMHSADGWCIGALPDSGQYSFAVVAGPSVWILADNTYTTDTWYFVAVVRDSGTWKLYVNGLLQADTMTTSPSVGYGTNTWIGNDGWGSPDATAAEHTDLSYAFIVGRPLASTDLLEIMAGEGGGDLEGWVLTVDEDGNPVWAPPPEAAPSDPSTDPTIWMPLTTVTGGVPELVWDGTDNLIPTLTPI